VGIDLCVKRLRKVVWHASSEISAA
jgi:hypothetical protein